MNRMVVHQSVVHPLDPLQLTELLPGTGWDSLGLHVGAAEEVEHWWSGGTGEQNLARLVDLLLQTRVTVLDVGRVRLELNGGFVVLTNRASSFPVDETADREGLVFGLDVPGHVRHPAGWWVVEAAADYALSPEPERLWSTVLRRQRGRLAMHAFFPADPTAN